MPIDTITGLPASATCWSCPTPAMLSFPPRGRISVLLGYALLLTLLVITAVAIVRERERGNLELLITTPVRSSELMLAKILPYVLIGLIQVTLVLLLGMGLPTTANYIVVSTLMGPVIVNLGAQNGLIVPLIAAHMFVFYFGILADDFIYGSTFSCALQSRFNVGQQVV